MVRGGCKNEFRPVRGGWAGERYAQCRNRFRETGFTGAAALLQSPSQLLPCRMITSRPSIAEYSRRLTRVVCYIEEHLHEPLPLETLADEACFSPFHFHRIFTAILGETPAAWIARLRVERAANMLIQDRSQSITSIALACGFSSSAVFARAFRERFGCTASEWRLNEGDTKNSKMCKTESNYCKASLSPGGYVELVNITESKTGEWSLIMNVEIKNLPEIHVAYLMHVGDYMKVHKAWERLCGWAGPRGLLGPDSMFLGISWDNPDITPADKLRYAACIRVPEGTATPEDILTMTVQGGKHAVARFEGRGEDIRKAYMELYGKWLPQSGFVPDDRPPYEVYLNDPACGTFVMDICMPVKEL
jgi:AraC family transcriptional regulator